MPMGTRKRRKPRPIEKPPAKKKKKKRRVITAGIVAVMLLLMPSRASGIVIVTFGDSTTAPRELSPGTWLTTYTDMLQAELPEVLGQPVTMINAGVGGNTTNNAVARLNADVLSQNPDYVIVQFGVNDAFVINGTTEPKVALPTYIANMQTILDGIRSVDAIPVLMSPLPLSYLIWFSAWEYEPYHDRVSENNLNRQYAASLTLLARDNNVYLVDSAHAAYNYWATHPNGLGDLHLDYVHPDEDGHRLEAELLKPVIQGFEDGSIILPVHEPSSSMLATIAIGLCTVTVARQKRRRR